MTHVCVCIEWPPKSGIRLGIIVFGSYEPGIWRKDEDSEVFCDVLGLAISNVACCPLVPEVQKRIVDMGYSR